MTANITTHVSHNTPPQSNWLVLTGAPCSGKTSVIRVLADRGYATVPEAARAYIDGCLEQGLTLAQIKSDAAAFERRILMDKVRTESALGPEDTIILDRAVPDSIAYYQFEGLDPAEPLKYSQAVRYKHILLFERLVFEKDAVRSENHADAKILEQLLESAYRRLGYTVIRIPAVSIEMRADLVSGYISGTTPLSPQP